MRRRHTGEPTRAPDALSRQEFKRVKLWARERFPRLASFELVDLIEECLDWHRSEGRLKVDWVATCRNWVRKEMRWRGIRERRAANSGSYAVRSTHPDKYERYFQRHGIRHAQDPKRVREENVRASEDAKVVRLAERVEKSI